MPHLLTSGCPPAQRSSLVAENVIVCAGYRAEDRPGPARALSTEVLSNAGITANHARAAAGRGVDVFQATHGNSSMPRSWTLMLTLEQSDDTSTRLT
jgi:hypothetical protein